MKNYYLGIDIGSVAIGTAVIDDDNLVIQSSYTFHKILSSGDGGSADHWCRKIWPRHL